MLPLASYNLPSRVQQRLVNCYVQQVPGQAPVELVGRPGIVPAVALEAGGRGLHVMAGELYAVSGNTLYRIDRLLGVHAVGDVLGAETLMFADHATELVTDNGYIYSGGTVGPITDPDFPVPAAVDFCDSFAVYVERNTGRFFASDLSNFASYDALQYATAEGAPDKLVTLIVDHRQVVLFGTDSTELWWNSGQAGFPFERMAQGFLEIGCAARLGRTKADNSVFWLASDRTIRRLSGTTPQRVSQHGVEEAIRGYERVDDCEAFAYPWNGHHFVVFRFPSAGACWVFDAATGEWHEAETYGAGDWFVVDVAECYGKVWVQHVDGRIGYLSDSAYTDFGETLRREWTYQGVTSGNVRQFHAMLDMICRTGDAPVGVVPYVQLEYSDDGGNRWRALPRRELGRIGEYARTVRWAALGTARNRVYRAAVSDPVPLHLLETRLDVTAGMP